MSVGSHHPDNMLWCFRHAVSCSVGEDSVPCTQGAHVAPW